MAATASRRRVLVLGLDGATFDRILPWAEAGHLPHFSRLMAGGAWGPLRTVVPPVTGPAWTSFLTGQNPGRHGLYDFMRRRAGSYDVQPVNATLRAAPSLWGLLSRAGKRVNVLNVPAIYPPEEVNGLLVTGMMTPPGAARFTHPPELGDALAQALGGYDIWPPDVFHPQGRERALVAALSRLTAQTERALDYLLSRNPDWDFSMAVCMATDTTQHFTWHFMDAAHSRFRPTADPALRDAILRCYQEMDAVLGRTVARLDDNTTLFVMSDHGFGPLEKYIHMNAWLLAAGFMRLKRSAAARVKRLLYGLGVTPIALYRLMFRLGMGRRVGATVRARKGQVRQGLGALFLSFADVDWSRTRAYSLGNIGPIYINLKGREPQGIVEPGDDYERTVSELAAAIAGWRDPDAGRAITGRLYRRDELFHGPQAAAAPDLFFLPDDLSYQAFGDYQFASHRWLAAAHDRTGAHRMDGIFIAAGSGVAPRGRLDNLSILDIAPTTLACLGVAVPAAMDGRVLHEAFLPGSLGTVTRDAAPVPQDAGGALSAEDEAAIRAQLKGLGYLG